MPKTSSTTVATFDDDISPEDVVLEKEMEQDIAEYKHAEETVSVTFINNVIQLGQILSEKKAKYIEGKQWQRYVSGIGRSLMYVNQFIRIYEYSLTNMKTLLDSNISNWHKAYTFLALPEDAKKEFKDIADLSGAEFDKKAKDLKNSHKAEEVELPDTAGEEQIDVSDDVIEHVEMDIPMSVLNGTDLDFKAVIGNSTLVDTHFMAKHVLKEFLGDPDHDFSQKCLPLVEGVLNVEKLLLELDNKNLKKSLTDKEKEYWSTQLKVQTKRLLEALLLF